MKRIFSKLIATPALLALLVLASACEKEETKKVYTIPATYNFVNAAGASTVDFSGQHQRLNMLSELSDYLKTANTAGVSLDAAVLKKMYANNAYTWKDPQNLGLTGATKQLKDKTAGGDAGIQTKFEQYFDQVAEISKATTANREQKYGVAGVWSDGSKNYLQTAQGVELTQFIEKGLMSAVFVNQLTQNYLVKVKTENNTDLVSGKTYTNMQHYWDEAYGYFTSSVDYPTTGTDRFWGKYAKGVETALGSATKLSLAFRTGRAAIDNQDYEVRDAQIEIIVREMEKVAAGSAIIYLNQAKLNLTNPTVLNHVLSEAYAFVDGLRYGQRAIAGTGMKVADIETALSYIGTDFEKVTVENLNKAINLIAEKTELTAYKDKL